MKKIAIIISLLALAACTPKTVEQTSTGVAVKPVKDQQPEIFSNVTYPEGTTFLSRPDVQRYIDRKVATGQFSRAEMEAFFANVQNKLKSWQLHKLLKPKSTVKSSLLNKKPVWMVACSVQ